MDDFWVKIVKEKYFKDCSFLKIKMKNYSLQFGRLLNLRQIFSFDIRWKIGNCKTVKF